jgi:hypothetical protein
MMQNMKISGIALIHKFEIKGGLIQEASLRGRFPGGLNSRGVFKEACRRGVPRSISQGGFKEGYL